MAPKTKVQDPVAEEMRRKDEKPTVSIGLARDFARERFGIAPPHFLDRFLFRIGRPATRVIPLNSYDDKNFMFYRRHMVKFYNGVESGHPAFIDAQARAMERVSSSGILTSVPRRCKDGKDVTYVDLERKDGGSEGGTRTTRHAMRVLSFIPGKILGDLDLDEKNVASLLDQAGTLIGKVDACFQGFDHIGFHRNHFWDLKHSMKLADFVAYIGNDARKALVLDVLANFEKKVLPFAHELRESVIHNDANDQNILTSEDGTRVIGILDYGDMVKSWLVNEVAIAMAYVMLNKKYFLRVSPWGRIRIRTGLNQSEERETPVPFGSNVLGLADSNHFSSLASAGRVLPSRWILQGGRVGAAGV